MDSDPAFTQMITTTCLDSKSRKFTKDFPAAELSDYCGVERNVVWADVSDPTSKDFDELAEEFGFHPLSIEDCRNAHQRPKVEEYPGYYFMVLYEAELVGPDDDLREGSVAAEPDEVVVAEQQQEGRRHVGGQPPGVRGEPGPPDLHRVEEREAEEQPAGDAARVLA